MSYHVYQVCCMVEILWSITYIIFLHSPIRDLYMAKIRFTLAFLIMGLDILKLSSAFTYGRFPLFEAGVLVFWLINVCVMFFRMIEETCSK